MHSASECGVGVKQGWRNRHLSVRDTLSPNTLTEFIVQGIPCFPQDTASVPFASPQCCHVLGEFHLETPRGLQCSMFRSLRRLCVV